MNDVVREKAYLNGIKYIDIQAAFRRRGRQLRALRARHRRQAAPGARGRRRAVHLAGYRKLAHFVEQEIKRDLQPGQERARHPPGRQRGRAEARQRAAGRRRSPTATAAGRARSPQPRTARPPSPRPPATAREAPAADTSNEQKADNGRIL